MPICGKPKQLLAHAEHCQLLRPNNLRSNLLQETLDLNKLCITQNADKENMATAPTLSATKQLMPAHTPIGPPLKRACSNLLSSGKHKAWVKNCRTSLIMTFSSYWSQMAHHGYLLTTQKLTYFPTSG